MLNNTQNNILALTQEYILETILHNMELTMKKIMLVNMKRTM